MKKKILAVFMGVCMLFCLTACGDDTSVNKKDDTEIETEKSTEKATIEVSDGEYETFVAGSLNKEQFEFILAHSPENMQQGEYSMEDLSRLLIYISDILSGGAESYISITGWKEDNANMYYNLSDVNNMIKIVTDFQFSEENNGTCPMATVSGDTLGFCYATPSRSYSAEIESAIIEDEIMTVEYKVHIVTLEDGEWDEMRTAKLEKNEEGSYQIQSIQLEEVLIPTWQEQYEAKIAEFLGIMDYYALHDMNGDDSPELIFEKQDADFPDNYNWSMYTCNAKTGMINEIYCDYMTGLRSAVWVNPFYHGLVDISVTPGDGTVYYTHIFVDSGEFCTETLKFFTWEQEKEEREYFANYTEQLKWSELSDTNLLKMQK